MTRTYEAILASDRLQWIGETPDQKNPARVQVIIRDEEIRDGERGRRMADALEKLAKIGGFSAIEDPANWQRAIRQDPSLPSRED